MGKLTKNKPFTMINVRIYKWQIIKRINYNFRVVKNSFLTNRLLANITLTKVKQMVDNWRGKKINFTSIKSIVSLSIQIISLSLYRFYLQHTLKIMKFHIAAITTIIQVWWMYIHCCMQRYFIIRTLPNALCKCGGP